MDNYINKIYELLYSPMITPYNLLENAKLENYSYVSYYKGECGLIAEMKCYIEGEGESTYYYHFNEKDRLESVSVKKGRKKAIVFDRKVELEGLIDTYNLNNKVEQATG